MRPEALAMRSESTLTASARASSGACTRARAAAMRTSRESEAAPTVFSSRCTVHASTSPS